MHETYPVEFNGKLVGNVAISREGLYYRFRCRLQLPKEDIYRLQLRNGDTCTDLGICVPVNDHFELDKRIPAKNLKDGSFVFKLMCNQSNERFIPIREDQPFTFIGEIHNARFSVRGNIPGIVLS